MAALVVEATDPEIALELVPDLVPEVELELAVVKIASLMAMVVVGAAIFDDAEET
jgi:hypothetical protein